MAASLNFPLKNPKPDFTELENVLKGEKEAERVHFVELFADPEVIASITEDLFGEKAPREPIVSNAPLDSVEEKRTLVKGFIDWWYRMGYDYVPLIGARVSGLNFPGK